MWHAKWLHLEISFLIAGKGHENYQIIGSETLQFDDMENAVEILKKTQEIMLYHLFKYLNNHFDFPGSGLFEFISAVILAVITFDYHPCFWGKVNSISS